MCGRARCSLRADDIPRACHQTGGSVRTVNMDRYRPSYNVAPGSNLAVVRREDDGSDGEAVVLHCMKWGLIPSFTKKNEKPDHFKMFNARSESIGEKASFRRLLPKNRCLVAVEGFYEWKKDGSKRQPYYIHLNDGRPLVFAALYDSWENSEGEKLYTFTIVTTSSSSALEWLHVFVKIELPSNDMFVVSNIDRMPVILVNKESCDTWLNGSSSYKFNTVLRPYENSDLVWYPVTPAMGKPTFDGPECIKEIKLKTDGNIPISKFFFTKGSKKEAEMNPEDKSSCEKSVKTDMPKCLKEEFEHREQEVQTTVVEKEEYDLKSSVHSLSQEGPSKCQMKRAYEELSADSKLTMDETEKLITSPAKKKGNLKSAGDNKQPTLFSYFGKS